MTEDEIRKAVEALETRHEKPSVRAVRTELGNRGSHTDIGAVLRKIFEQRERLNVARHEMPQVIQDKAKLLAMDCWEAAQDLAGRGVEDARYGAEQRVARAEEQADEIMRHADQAEAQVLAITAIVEEKNSTIARLNQSEHDAIRRASGADLQVAILEAELRVSKDDAERRGKELQRLYRILDMMPMIYRPGNDDKTPTHGRKGKRGGNTAAKSEL